MFTIILFIYFNTIFILKKGFEAPYQEIAAETLTFFEILFVDANKFSSGTSDFFPFPYTRSVCKLTGTSRVKSFSSYHTVLSIMRVLRSNFSANAMVWAHLLLRHPSFISGIFTLLKWRKFLLFIVLLIDERLIPVCLAILRGARCVCGASYCEQISSSMKSVFSSLVTNLGRPEPSFLFMMPLSLKPFKSLFTDV